MLRFIDHILINFQNEFKYETSLNLKLDIDRILKDFVKQMFPLKHLFLILFQIKKCSLNFYIIGKLLKKKISVPRLGL